MPGNKMPARSWRKMPEIQKTTGTKPVAFHPGIPRPGNGQQMPGHIKKKPVVCPAPVTAIPAGDRIVLQPPFMPAIMLSVQGTQTLSIRKDKVPGLTTEHQRAAEAVHFKAPALTPSAQRSAARPTAQLPPGADWLFGEKPYFTLDHDGNITAVGAERRRPRSAPANTHKADRLPGIALRTRLHLPVRTALPANPVPAGCGCQQQSANKRACHHKRSHPPASSHRTCAARY